MTTTVVVGAGAAGLACAMRVRELSPQRTVVLIDKDADAPYDRPPLSKTLSSAPTVSARRASLIELGVDLRIDRVRHLDVAAQRVKMERDEISYDELVLCPGSRPRRPQWAGPGVHLLHTLGDNRRLGAALQDARAAVVVGGGFIGAELASSLTSAGLEVTLVFRDGSLFSRFGDAISQQLSRIHVEAGVRLVSGTDVRRVTTMPTGQMRVELSDGQCLHTDLVVAGVGSEPETRWLGGSGLLDDGGRILTDEHLRAAPTIWAAGDSVVVRAPSGGRCSSSHWTSARAQGRHVADDLVAGTATRFPPQTYFWSMQHGNLLQAVGDIGASRAGIEVATKGGRRPSVMVGYRRDGVLVGVVAINEGTAFLAARQTMEVTEPRRF